MSRTSRGPTTRKKLLAWAAVALVVFLTGFVWAPQAQAAQATDSNACSLMPLPLQQAMCNVVTGNADEALSYDLPSPTDIISGVAGSGLDAILSNVIKAESDTIASELGKQWQVLNEATVPNTTKPWYTGQYALLFYGACFIAFVGFATRQLRAAREGDLRGVGEGVVSFIAFFIAGMFVPAIVFGLTWFFDMKLTPALLESSGTNTRDAINSISQSLADIPLSTTQALLAPAIIGFIGVIAAVIIAIEFALRGLALLYFTAVEVVVLALWVSGSEWGRQKLVQNNLTLIGLITFKFWAALALTIGTSMLANQQNLDAVIIGALVCAIIPFVTYEMYKRISRHDPHAGRISRQTWALVRQISK